MSPVRAGWRADCGKSWDFHVEHALCTTLEENLNMISDSIKYLMSKGKRVFFSLIIKVYHKLQT